MKQLTIAHIDDNKAARAVLQSSFDDHTIIPYMSYTDYLKSYNEHHVVIMDLNMPDYTWQAFEETVQKEHCPCFVYSGTELSLLGADTTNNMKTLGVTHIFEKGRDDQKIVRWVNYYAENGRFDDE